MLEKPTNSQETSNEVDPAIARIVTQIQEKHKQLKILEKSDYKPAEKDAILKQISKELADLNTEKIRKLEEKNKSSELASGKKEMTEEEVADILERAHQLGL